MDSAMFELCLMCPEDRVESLSEALDALDALSVSVEDADAQTDAEQALFGEPGMPPPKEGWQRSRVTALFSSEALAQEAADLLQAQEFFDGCQLLSISAVPDQDWVRNHNLPRSKSPPSFGLSQLGTSRPHRRARLFDSTPV
jgi:ribosomal protein L11 methyltransferase